MKEFFVCVCLCLLSEDAGDQTLEVYSPWWWTCQLAKGPLAVEGVFIFSLKLVIYE